MRCSQLRQRIVGLAKNYMAKVEQEYEMRYLLMEKDFDNRDLGMHTLNEFKDILGL